MTLHVETYSSPKIQSDDDVIEVKTHDVGSLRGLVRIGGNWVNYEQFFAMVEYVLDNTDLAPNDLRLEFLERIKTARKVAGFNKGAERIEFEIPWATWNSEGGLDASG